MNAELEQMAARVATLPGVISARVVDVNADAIRRYGRALAEEIARRPLDGPNYHLKVVIAGRYIVEGDYLASETEQAIADDIAKWFSGQREGAKK